MANVLCPPSRRNKPDRTRPSIYLAGPFGEGGWRDEAIAAIADLDVDVFDPRDGVWETAAAGELPPGALRGKLEWQITNAADATVVVFWLPRDVVAPTALLQLGMLAAKRGGAKRGSSVIVGPEGDPNDLVRAFVGAMRVFLMPTLADVMRAARYELTRSDGA
jgi:hypothetical protein